MLAWNLPIHADLVEEVRALSHGHPVFLLTGGGGSLVLKQEGANVRADQLRFNAKIMAAVDPMAKSVPLSLAEVAELLRIANRFPASQAAQEVGQLYATSPGAPWLKMRALHLVELKPAADARWAGGDKTEVRELRRSLSASGGLEELGAVLAADLFSGNRDRFSFSRGDIWFYGPANAQQQGKRLLAIANIGNFVWRRDEEGRLHASGLDSFDPNSPYLDLSAALPAGYDQDDPHDPDAVWGGLCLGEGDRARNRRRQLARAVVADLEYLFGHRDRRFLSAHRQAHLPRQAAGRIVTGIERGAEAIRGRVLRHLQKHAGRPEGLAQRAQSLGWWP